MDKIVQSALKIDLHIHSIASKEKDGKKVVNNTLENIPLLISKLSENEVNLCAITDHDVFSYEIYRALKESEIQDNPIYKVLPGAEFSVNFCHAGTEKTLHIVTIFSDENDEKIKKMEEIINKNRPGDKGAYSEMGFLELLREINVDTVFIVHQKRSLSGSTPGGNDANALGIEKFFEFVYTDYFEAFEFRNKRNEVFNKAFIRDNDLEGKVCFVTGTDCHDWTVYPNEDKTQNVAFPFTFAKCLPTFKGLVMAMTDHTRLKTGNSSFFCADKYYLPEIKYAQNGQIVTIPLSKGINVIIGDNSVGKSLLLHAMTSYRKKNEGLLSGRVEDGYKKYLREHGIEIKTKLQEKQVFLFDMQGEVRSKFEEHKLPTSDFLRKYFPDSIDPSHYRMIIEKEIDRMIAYLERKFSFDTAIKQLNSFSFLDEDIPSESLNFKKNLRAAKPKSKKYTDIITAIDKAIVAVEGILAYKANIDLADEDEINTFLITLRKMKEKYSRRIDDISSECDRIEKVASVIDKVSEANQRSTSDIDKKKESFLTNKEQTITKISQLMKDEKELTGFTFHISSVPVVPNHRKLHNYEFICRLKIEEISNSYMQSLLKRVLKKHEEIDWYTIQESNLKAKLLNVDPRQQILSFFKQSMMEKVNEDLHPEFSIIIDGEDRFKQMSAGLNAKTYFDLLSYESFQDGLYIIDQPEDNISQSAIREYLLDRFKTMGENRQVIIVTHNPQFVVNLDVDNLIFLSEKENHITIQSGALEYVCPQYNILDIVANNIDGGLESIKKRWKRYEKTADI